MNPKKRKGSDEETNCNSKVIKVESEEVEGNNTENTNTSDCGTENRGNSDGQQKSDNGGSSEEPGPSEDTSSDCLVANEVNSVKEESGQTNKKSDAAGAKMAGTVLFCGGTNWDLIGRKELPKSAKGATGRNLWGPHRLSALSGIRVTKVVSSNTACHSVIITEAGRVMSWGRNDKGQLGLGHTKRTDEPSLIEGLKEHFIVSAACGRSHTLFLSDRGAVYACGDNKMGQCGLGNQNSPVTAPAKVNYKSRPIEKLACGAEFSVIVDVKGGLYTFGLPEYGQLGHNSDGRYFVTSNKLSFRCELVPRRVIAYIEKTREGHVTLVDDVQIVDVACGTNHTVVMDSRKRCFSWGFGGYGRLGHAEPKDEMVPRLVKSFDGPNRGVKGVWAGGQYSMAISEYGALFFWGQNKRTGDATMYPKPVSDLAGWQIRDVGCSNCSIVVVADESVISWGPSPTYGELGYGENRQKSSTTPMEVRPLEGVHIHAVSCGYGHTLFIAQDDTEEDRAKLNKFPEFTP